MLTFCLCRDMNNMNEIKQQVTEIVLDILQNLNSGLELYDLSYRQGKQGWILQVQLQADHFIDINEIVEVNDLLSERLDQIADLFPESYTLDVSSAGLERAIRNEHELSLAINHQIKVSCYRKLEQNKVFVGKLVRYDADVLELLLNDGENLKIPRDYIAHLNYALTL